MRILVADQNALLLAAITATFGKHCDLVTATRREVCMEYAEQGQFDVVVACDKLADYTGLELLSEISEVSPETLLIFAASNARLERLGHRLEAFALFETLAYPITPRKLLNTLKAARAALPSRAERKVRHVVLESEWDTGERLAMVETELDWGPGEPAPGADWAVMPDAGAGVRVAPKPKAAAGTSARVSRAETSEPRSSRADDGAPIAHSGGARTSARANDNMPMVLSSGGPVPELPAAFDNAQVIESGDDEFVFAMPMTSGAAIVIEATAVPATQDGRWEVSEHEGFVYEAPSPAQEFLAAEEASAVADARAMGERPGEPVIPVIEVMAPDAVVADTDSTLGQVDYEDIGNDPVFDVPETPQWAEDGAANDIAFESNSLVPTGRGSGGQTLSATQTSGGAWSVNGAHGESAGGASGGAAAGAAHAGSASAGSAHARSAHGYWASGGEAESAGHESNRPACTPADVAAAWYASDTRASATPGAGGGSKAAAGSKGVESSAAGGSKSTDSSAATGSEATVGATSARSGAAAGSGATTGSTGASAPGAAQAAAQAAHAGANAGVKATARAPDTNAKPAKNSTQPQGRKPTASTAAQREAFERALARRNAERAGGVGAESAGGTRRRGRKNGAPPASVTQPVDTAAVGSMYAEPLSGASASSLSNLARAATHKRPLPSSNGGFKKPKRAVFAVGSGLAAAILVAVLTFQLIHDPQSEPHHRRTQVASTQVFSPQTTLLSSQEGDTAPQLVAPPPEAQQEVPLGTEAPQPLPETFDPDTAPPDPPPPPALEHPGPMEPPSEEHTGPPLGMIPGSEDSQ